MERVLGTVSRGIRLPIIKNGEENLIGIITGQIEKAQQEARTMLRDRDIICITESIIARAANNYISVDDIANDITAKYGEKPELMVLWPIYSRNRFSIILKGVARACSKILLVLDDNKDEVGNDKVNPFTGINIEEFYNDLIKSENCECEVLSTSSLPYSVTDNVLYARCHADEGEIARFKEECLRHNGKTVEKFYELTDICSEPDSCHGYNTAYGVLGSNKATEESLKLFPTHQSCKHICETIKAWAKEQYGADIEVMVYGDGCFKDPVGGIWEFADPVVSPYFTDGLNGTPSEIKIKYVADNESANTDYIVDAIKHKADDLKGNMISQGTTPRRYCDLVGSLADLTSGSGDKGTPVIWISGYFDNYANE